ncbi:hypothetical protein GCM10023264_10830 [Sphingomonas daechungensis]|uniref:Uncharacterized protein n=1 Tax=Sphingomonas daechungensis TaxID=1176646 RepID=A0ABX6T6F6_9SPHN|nr:hypothetical protein [Sphingomonas daechungensis]QNP44595.1 hypothetical protein H9L15_16065 [Sphingomonas daechungensis]
MRVAVLALAVLFAADPAYAYMGPGAGLAFIGSLFALIAAVGIGALGLIWYPLKKLFRSNRGSEMPDRDA